MEKHTIGEHYDHHDGEYPRHGGRQHRRGRGDRHRRRFDRHPRLQGLLWLCGRRRGVWQRRSRRGRQARLCRRNGRGRKRTAHGIYRCFGRPGAAVAAQAYAPVDRIIEMVPQLLAQIKTVLENRAAKKEEAPLQG